MNTAAHEVPPVTDVPSVKALHITDDYITAYLSDRRIVSVPLSWSWRLAAATPEERLNFVVFERGVHWPDLDEDISVWGMLYGVPARRPPAGGGHLAPFWTPERIKSLRGNLSQSAFAQALGVRQATVSDWERGRREPNTKGREALGGFSAP